MLSVVHHARWLVLLSLLAFLASAPALASSIPAACHQWQRPLTRIAQFHHGWNAPVSLYGAIIRQESSCRHNARSPVGALGLAQFMPGTVQHVGELDRSLRGWDPLNPAQSLQALLIYYRWLDRQAARLPAADACQQAAFSLSGYNGGFGWTQRDVRLCRAATGCDPLQWFGHVEHHTARAAWANRENRHYVQVILKRWQPDFVRAGWLGAALCEE